MFRRHACTSLNCVGQPRRRGDYRSSPRAVSHTPTRAHPRRTRLRRRPCTRTGSTDPGLGHSVARLRFKLDENLPRGAVTLLEQAGHDVDTVPNQNLAGHPDAEVLQACQQERRTLVTLDLGFADLGLDRKSTRLNSSHLVISYAVFCLKKKKTYHVAATH